MRPPQVSPQPQRPVWVPARADSAQLPVRENPSPPFTWHVALLRAVTACEKGEAERLLRLRELRIPGPALLQTLEVGTQLVRGGHQLTVHAVRLVRDQEALIIGLVDDLPVAHIAIHIVTQEEKELRPILEDGLPDQLRPFLMRARAKGNARQRRRRLGAPVPPPSRTPPQASP